MARHGDGIQQLQTGAHQEKVGRLGFAAIALDWERPFSSPLYAWSSAIQGKWGPMKVARGYSDRMWGSRELFLWSCIPMLRQRTGELD